MSAIQPSAGRAGQSVPAEADAEALRSAFQAFEAASRQLSDHYDRLTAEIARLDRALTHTNQQRIAELEAKERLAARLQNLLAVLPAGVVVLDSSGCIQEFNSAAERLLDGIQVGAHWAAVAGDNVQPRWDDGHDLTLKCGRRVNISTQALTHEAGQIVLLTDVSETRGLQDRLALHARLSANTQMAAALAHQLRTPIATAMLAAAQIGTVPGDPAAGARAGGRIRDALRKLERLIEDVLQFARGGGIETESVTSVEFLAMLGEALLAARLSDSIDIVTPNSVAEVPLQLNSGAVISVTLNVIQNALQAGATRLDIECRPAGPLWILALSDNGPGIPVERHEAVFEPFYTTRGGGTGMGLAVARSVVRAHGGDLTLDAGCQNGACLLMALPVVEPASVRARQLDRDEL